MTSNRVCFVGNPQSQFRSVAQWTGGQDCLFLTVAGLGLGGCGATSVLTGGRHDRRNRFERRLNPNRDTAEGGGP